MLKERVIPALLIQEGHLVKGRSFDSWRRVGTALPAVTVNNTRDVDELIVLDISASAEHRGPDVKEIMNLSERCSVPFTVGGGIRSVDTVRSLLMAGADKVAINSALYEDPNLVSEVADRFGSQCVVASVDVKTDPSGTRSCWAFGGTVPIGVSAARWAKSLENAGAGEILLTSIDRDGTLEGFDLDLIAEVADSVTIPVIAAGGAGTYAHLLQALQVGASAVGVGAMFLFTEQTPGGARAYLERCGRPVRRVMEKAG